MTRKKMGEQRRGQILDGLLRVVADCGLQNSNMTQVAQAAGVSRGILHYYFRSKDEMVSALVGHVRDQLIPRYRDSIAASAEPWEQLHLALWAPVESLGVNGVPLARVWIEFWGLAEHHPGVRTFILEVQDEVRRYFFEVVSAGQRAGVFRDGANAERVAALVLSALQGLMLQWHYRPDKFSYAGSMKELEQMLRRHLAP